MLDPEAGGAGGQADRAGDRVMERPHTITITLRLSQTFDDLHEFALSISDWIRNLEELERTSPIKVAVEVDGVDVSPPFRNQEQPTEG
jgi:hypothetical protein